MLQVTISVEDYEELQRFISTSCFSTDAATELVLEYLVVIFIILMLKFVLLSEVVLRVDGSTANVSYLNTSENQ